MVLRPCKHCGSSGNSVGVPIYNSTTYTGGLPALQIPILPCRFCGGTGYIDEDELITIKRKYVKDEYFTDKI